MSKDNMDYHERRQRRRTRKAIRRFLIMLIAVIAMLLMAWVITSIINWATKDDNTSPNTQAGAQNPAVSAAPVGTENSENPEGTPTDGAAWKEIGPQEQPAEGVQIVSPDYRMMCLPENGRVDMSYFDTVTFVGDSLTQGFEIYTQGIPNAHYCAYKGIGPKQIYDGSIQKRQDGTQEVPMEALVASAPDNVYIQLGANSMVGMDDESIIAYYREMLNQIRNNLHPDVGIYVQSLTPVRPDNTPGFDMARIHSLNNALAQLAWEEGVYFLDLLEPLAGEDGFLREDYAGGDGYHLSPSGYAAWVEYLVTHTAYHPRNPYLEGSEYYQPDAPAEDTAEAA